MTYNQIQMADYQKAVQCALNTFEELETTDFNYNMQAAITNRYSDIFFLPYHQLPMRYFAEFHCSKTKQKVKDGFTITLDRLAVFIVIINERVQLSRLRFTIAHELGHIQLEHLEADARRPFATDIFDPNYKDKEKEADVFARNLLAPAPYVLYMMQLLGFSCIWSSSDHKYLWKDKNGMQAENTSLLNLISETFGISKTAAICRIGSLHQDMKRCKSFYPNPSLNRKIEDSCLRLSESYIQ